MDRNLTQSFYEFPFVAIVVSDGRGPSWTLTLASELTTMIQARVKMVAPPPEPRVGWGLKRSSAPPMRNVGTFVTDDVKAVGLDRAPDLFIDLTGKEPAITATNDAPTLRPVYNGDLAERSTLKGLAPPKIEIEFLNHGTARILHRAVIAVPDPNVVSRVLKTIRARTVSLIVEAVLHVLRGRPLPALPVVELTGLRDSPWHGVLRPFRRLSNRWVGPGLWNIGVRRRTQSKGHLPDIGEVDSFQILPCPTDRYLADPFLFEHDGETYLFFEEFFSDLGKGIVSVLELGNESTTEPRPVLERPYHLSYPFVFNFGGRIFMIPETSLNRTVELYQATRFPFGWELRSILLSDIEASDATVHQDEHGRWWLFLTASRCGDSGWDTLSLFYADDLHGPWTPHPMNPVKNDARSSRPAGPLISWNGSLLRPAQDCSRGYGHGLSLCEVVELSTGSFRERVVAHTSFSRGGFRGPHTYGLSSSYEVIDFKWRTPQPFSTPPLRPFSKACPA